MLQGTAAAGAALFPCLPVVFAARVFEGLGFQATTVAVPALIATAMPKDTRAPALAAWSTFMPVGLCVALAGAPLLLTHGWQTLWWASALLAFAWAVLLLIWAPRGPQRERHQLPAAALREVVHARGPRLLGLLFFLFSATYFSLAGFLPVLLVQAGVQDPSHASRLAGWAVLAGAAGNLLGAWLLARGVCAQRLVRTAFLLTAICTTGVLMIDSGVGLRYALCLAFCVVSALIPPALFAQVPLRAPRNHDAGQQSRPGAWSRIGRSGASALELAGSRSSRSFVLRNSDGCSRRRKTLGTLCTNQRAVCICGLGQSAAQANTRNSYGYCCVLRLAAPPDPQRTLTA
jgi:MFS family permease